jgi:dinuclear metal center YbgI/SA1388 family protein
MTIQDIINCIESTAPVPFQENYDNAGLILGHPDHKVKKILLCLDSTEAVVDEAVDKGCNLIIAHHPVIFNGLKKLTGQTYVERTILKAIKNNISIYAAHTNLDNIRQGVNAMISEKLGLINCRVLAPKKNVLKKLYVFCPFEQAEKVRRALFKAGAGRIGNYDECSFNVSGTGTFKAGDGTSPYVGEIRKQHQEKEIKIETIFPYYLESRVIDALIQSQPYADVAYDIISLDNDHPPVGAELPAHRILRHENARLGGDARPPFPLGFDDEVHRGAREAGAVESAECFRCLDSRGGAGGSPEAADRADEDLTRRLLREVEKGGPGRDLQERAAVRALAAAAREDRGERTDPH